MASPVGKKISFAVVIALLLGWGAVSLLLIQSSKELLQAQLLESGTLTRLPQGIRLRLEVDKNVYGPGDAVLISVRNDSKKPVWLAEHADGCVESWWRVERLFDGDDWQPVQIFRSTCTETVRGILEFPEHTIKTASWDGLVQTPELGQVFDHVPTGTYRISVPFLSGEDVSEADWSKTTTQAAVSAAFTVQGSTE